MTALQSCSESGPRSPACIACGGRTESTGVIRAMDGLFVRAAYGGPLRGRWDLVRCARCGLEFRWPLPSQEVLTAAYSRMPATLWQARPLGCWSKVRAELARLAPGRRVLDVGCYCGAFLDWLGPGWERCGVEPSEEAAAEARRVGVSIVGPDVACLERLDEEFDAMVMMDLLEHVAGPVAALRSAWKALRPGGVLVIVTGNADALPWRLYGTDYYYCRLPEHVVFFRPGWFKWLCGELPFELARVTPLRHNAWRLGPWLGWAARYAVWLPVVLYGRLRLRSECSPFVNRYAALLRGLAPGPGDPARDHMLVSLRKLPAGRKG